MNDVDLQAVRQLVIDAFRWVDGHADLSRVFRSSEVVRVVGAALAAPGQPPSRHLGADPHRAGLARAGAAAAAAPDALRPTDRVLVVDDSIETGHQADAIASTCTGCCAPWTSRPAAGSTPV